MELVWGVWEVWKKKYILCFGVTRNRGKWEVNVSLVGHLILSPVSLLWEVWKKNIESCSIVVRIDEAEAISPYP